VTPAVAQLGLNTSVTLATPYVWRGVTRANGASLQPEGFISVGVFAGYLTAGVWGNIELGNRSPGNLSELGPDRPGLSEANAWVQLNRNLGDVETTIGAVSYAYLGDGPLTRTSRDNTTELYAGLQLTSTYLVPRMAAYIDVDHVRGVYLEASGTAPLLGYPFGNPIVLYATGLVGFNLSQEVNPDHPEQGANFRHDGFTHADFSLRATVNLGRTIPLAFNIEPHWQFKIDDFTKRTSPEPGDANRHIQFWLGVSVSTGVTLIPRRVP
jgi:hypothetical protein